MGRTGQVTVCKSQSKGDVSKKLLFATCRQVRVENTTYHKLMVSYPEPYFDKTKAQSNICSAELCKQHLKI